MWTASAVPLPDSTAPTRSLGETGTFLTHFSPALRGRGTNAQLLSPSVSLRLEEVIFVAFESPDQRNKQVDRRIALFSATQARLADRVERKTHLRDA